LDWLIDPQFWASLLTLTALEIVLGIDNLVFIAILASRLPAERRDGALQMGLAMALLGRLALLASIAWIMRLRDPIFHMLGHPSSWRDIILIIGGLFLLYKGTSEIHHRLEGDAAQEVAGYWQASFGGIVVQIMLIDIVFSLDSVITAVGMVSDVWVMATAIILAVVLMLAASRRLIAFIDKYPTVKMLALSFLLMIGMMLIADGTGFHVPREYAYAAIGFSIVVEALNQLAARRPHPTGQESRREPKRLPEARRQSDAD
jgi:predicted tellurium resistance membrane protein TerC